jgi:hypothetical protein
VTQELAARKRLVGHLERQPVAQLLRLELAAHGQLREPRQQLDPELDRVLA